MNTNLLLAEALDVLKKAETREHHLDRLQEQVAKSAKRHRELSKLKNDYSAVYDTYIRALEMVNFVRRSAMGSNEELVRFCGEKMNFFMNHCDKLREKETNILVPIDEADEVVKDGFRVERTIKLLSPVLSRGQPYADDFTLSDGCYEVILKNMDQYSVVAPTVQIAVQIRPLSGQAQVYRKEVPSQCGWCKFIGVVSSANVRILVGTDAFVRKSHVTIELRQLSETKADGQWLEKLPKIDESELTMLTLARLPVDEVGGLPPPPKDSIDELKNLHVPYHTASPVSPKVIPPAARSLTLEERLKIVQRATEPFPSLPMKIAGPALVLSQRICALPEPTEICGDVEVGDFDVSAADLEGE